MGKITILDDHIANQIAAGEVVERPASVVKELIENSIDANSTIIEISIIDGGLSLIKIKDNGDGIEDEDIEKAFFRHATSKIKTGKDLFRIRSLGFRGEALPSIAAVSRIELKTSTSKNGQGKIVTIQGGKVIANNDIAFSKGTEIIVKDLFFNTPARLKYLKSLQTELGHTIDYCNKLSIAYPNISFSLNHNGRNILRTKGDDNLLHTLAATYGSGIAKNMVYFAEEDLDFKISGYISKPEITRANRNHISIFVNGRFVKNFVLSHTVVKGYSTLLMVNRFPIAVLRLEMDPSLVDVNVHPAKLEVRFSKEQELVKYLEATIGHALRREVLIREPISSIYNSKDIETTQNTINFKLSNPQEGLELTEEAGVENNTRNNQVDNNESEYIQASLNNDYRTVNETLNTFGGLEFEHDRIPLLDPIAQLRGTYIVAQSEKGLYLIDQHAAHERIQYEKNLRLFNSELKSSQELLIPITLDYSRKELEDILAVNNKFLEAGLILEQFGLQTLIIRSVPQWIPDGKENEYVQRLIEMVQKDDKIDFLALNKEMIASQSCKSSIKANQFMTKKEMEVLIEQLRNTENPFSCPHGRPTIIHFSFYDIEKMFKRVV